MSFSVIYENPFGFHSCEKRPYDDFLHRGSPPAIFKYCSRNRKDIIRVHFVPDFYTNFFHLELRLDYYTADLLAEIEIEKDEKTIVVRRLLCTNENRCPDLYMDSVPKCNNDSGGVYWYKRHINCFGADLNLQTYVHKFFGKDWRLSKLPLTLPKVSADQIESVKTCETRLGRSNDSWGRLAGTFFVDRMLAATVIQKHFRGWRVRMETTFNPNSPFGFACLKRRFLGFSEEDLGGCAPLRQGVAPPYVAATLG